MTMRPTRRGAILGGASAIFPAGGARAQNVADIAAIERGLGGHIGFSALDAATGARIRHRADERFAMCSTFKAALAAAVLARIDAGEVRAGDVLIFDPAALLGTSRATAARPDGRISVLDACEAVVSVSDNTAANLLLDLIGGPPAMTGYFRALGDDVSRLDRYELDLNSNIGGDPRDTTTPDAMLGVVQALLLGDALTPASRALLTGWMENEQNGTARLRAGAPAGWRVANKPGTSVNGAVNDIAVFWPPDRAPIVLTAYVNAPEAELADAQEAIAAMARMTVRAFA